MKLLSHDLCDSGWIRTGLGLGFSNDEERRENGEVEREWKKENERNRV